MERVVFDRSTLPRTIHWHDPLLWGTHTLKIAKLYKILSNSFEMKGREDANMWTHFVRKLSIVKLEGSCVLQLVDKMNSRAGTWLCLITSL